MCSATTATNAPAERRRASPGAAGSDWLDEVTADVCGGRAMAILVHALATEHPHACTTATALQQVLAES